MNNLLISANNFSLELAVATFEWTTLKYLIQNRKTREYFHQGQWTLDSRWAQEYPNVGQAMIACLRHQLDDVELELHFGWEARRSYSLQLSLAAQLGAIRASYEALRSGGNSFASASSLEMPSRALRTATPTTGG